MACPYLFITHDMAVVEKVSHRVAVLYLGQIVELGTRRQIFESPQHAYTRKLLAAVPVAEPGRHIDTSLIEGEIPSPVRPRRRRAGHHSPGRVRARPPGRPRGLIPYVSTFPVLEATMHFLSKTFSATALAWPWAPPCPPRTPPARSTWPSTRIRAAGTLSTPS